jgi:actin-binding protein IPP
MQTARCQMGVAVLDRYLYVVGGNNVHQEVLNTVERYSFDEDKWTSCTPMSVGRASPAVASADGLLYVAGGDQVIGDSFMFLTNLIIHLFFQTCEVNFYRAQITVSAFECYDPGTDSWKSCPDLPMSRSEAGAVVV